MPARVDRDILQRRLVDTHRAPTQQGQGVGGIRKAANPADGFTEKFFWARNFFGQPFCALDCGCDPPVCADALGLDGWLMSPSLGLNPSPVNFSAVFCDINFSVKSPRKTFASVLAIDRGAGAVLFKDRGTAPVLL